MSTADRDSGWADPDQSRPNERVAAEGPAAHGHNTEPTDPAPIDQATQTRGEPLE